MSLTDQSRNCLGSWAVVDFIQVKAGKIILFKSIQGKVHTIPHIAQHVRIATLAILYQLSIRGSDTISMSNRGGR
jgi:hypothetical protein